MAEVKEPRMVERMRVWNLHTEEYTEEIAGKKYVIAPQKFIDLPKDEGLRLVKRFSPIVRDGAGRDLKPKMLREDIYKCLATDVKPEAPTFKCMVDNKEFKTEKEYTKHVLDFHSNEALPGTLEALNKD